MPLNAIEEHRYQLAILFGQLVVQNKAKYSAFSAAFLRQQFHEVLGYPAHYIRNNEDIKAAVTYGARSGWRQRRGTLR